MTDRLTLLRVRWKGWGGVVEKEEKEEKEEAFSTSRAVKSLSAGRGPKAH